MKLKLTSIAAIAVLMFSCGEESQTDSWQNNESENNSEAIEEVVESIDPMKDKGVGPITTIELGDINPEMVEAGETAFEASCTACHKMGKRYVGPDLNDVTNRRTSEWIMNMILDPEGMVANNKAAKDLLAEYSAPMANQNLTEEQARAILEYFRSNDNQ